MATPSQIEANRANAQHSTGPLTPEGVNNCKNNATKHGLCSAQICIKGEDPAAYDAMRAQLIEQHAPESEVEAMLVEQIAQQWWRLSRARRIEAKMFDEFGEIEVYTNKAYLNLQRQVTVTERAWNRALKDLRDVQDRRAKQEEKEDEAIRREFIAPPIGSVFAKSPQPSAAPASTPATSHAATLRDALAVLRNIDSVRKSL